MSPTSSKRKAQQPPHDDDDNDEETNDDDHSDVQMIDVSFEFFDPQPQDYQSIKLLLQQLLSGDSIELDTSSIANLVIEQKLVGTTVKTDGGNQGDPYAVLTVLNLNVHKEREGVQDLIKYIMTKSINNPPLHDQLTELLSTSVQDSSETNPKHVGLVLCERLVNMPAQIVPPMYKMLVEELQWAREDGEPYHFSHLLFLSRVFIASMNQLDQDPNAGLMSTEENQIKSTSKTSKKAKKGQHVDSQTKDEEQTWMYHPEDEVIARYAQHQHVFKFSHSNKQSNAEQDSFGVLTKGQLMLIPWLKFENVVKEMEEYLK
ncbi:Mss4p nuclear export [Microbotryomycetes sp. JL221]|nr:Mss4p nuclear export [Microbotryomycetes sp. JL221]